MISLLVCSALTLLTSQDTGIVVLGEDDTWRPIASGFPCAVPYQCYRPDGVCMSEHMWFLETQLWLLSQS